MPMSMDMPDQRPPRPEPVAGIVVCPACALPVAVAPGDVVVPCPHCHARIRRAARDNRPFLPTTRAGRGDFDERP